VTDSLAGYMRHVAALNPAVEGPLACWSIDGQVVGWLTPAAWERLRVSRGLFIEVGERQLGLSPALADFAARSEALAGLVAELADEGRINAPIAEPYPVTAGERDQALCQLERTAAGFFGIRAFGQHLNGYVRDGERMLMWLGRRSGDRCIYPGRLDNLVAGGLPHGIGLEENLVKECFEEAGMAADLARGARHVSTVRYNAAGPHGLKPDVLYCYDLELPADFRPVNTDGEVAEFLLLPIEEVARLVRETDEFKLNCNLVIVDFLVRHGFIHPDQAGYPDLISGLRPESGAAFAALI
jgi:8-oxo-dGTP pyrophosphatase MutT (NUDIX family)